MDVYERPRQKSFKLLSKPGKEKKDKDRGELEVCIAFQVKSDFKGSLADLSGKKEKKGSTLGLGGSLLSLGTLEKRKGLKNFAKSMGSKLHINGKSSKKDKQKDGESISDSVSSIGTPGSEAFAPRRFGQVAGEADPGVVSEDDEDEFVFDNLSHKSSGSSLNVRGGGGGVANVAAAAAAAAPTNSDHLTVPGSAAAAAAAVAANSTSSTAEDIKLRSKTLPPSKPPRIASDPPAAAATDEWESKLYGKHLEIGSSDSLKRRSWESSRVPLSSTQEEEGDPVAAAAAGESPQPRRLIGSAAHPSTAPTTPNLEDQKRAMVDAAAVAEKPRPLPRSGTLESIEEKEAAAVAAATPDKKEKSEKRFSKLKFLHKKDKAESLEDLKMKLTGGQKQFGSERVIIGHENDRRQQGDVKVSPELLKKYDGKSREVHFFFHFFFCSADIYVFIIQEMILVANDLENEVKMQKLKMKEMEDYLDNLLLRVMETHPKILQNPYRNQLSAKR